MKLILQIVAAILISGLIGWAAYNPTDLRNKALGTTPEENDKAFRDAGFVDEPVRYLPDTPVKKSNHHKTVAQDQSKGGIR